MRATWWWTDRWRKSTAFTDMTLAEQGAYRNLLDEVVLREDGIIPEGSLGRACGDPVAWPGLAQRVLKWMRRVGGGWTNDTALEVKAKGAELHRVRSNAGARGAAKRQQTPQQNASKTPASASANTYAPSPSPSPSPEQTTATTLLPPAITTTATTTTPMCPTCGQAAVVRERYPRGVVAGWVCWKQRRGCGALYAVNDPTIIAQLSGQELGILKASILRESGLRGNGVDGQAMPVPRASDDPAVPAKWEHIREHLRGAMKPDQWKLWVEVIVPLRFEESGETIVLLSPHPGHAEWLINNHGEVFNNAVKAAGLAAFKIEFPHTPPPKGRGLPL